MSEQQLINIGRIQSDETGNQLRADLEKLTRAGVPEKIREAAQTTLQDLENSLQENANEIAALQKKDSATLQQKVLQISHTLDFLRLAQQQRSNAHPEYQNRGWFARLIRRILPGLFRLEPPQPDMAARLEQIEELIQSCYEPFMAVLPAPAVGQPSRIVLPEKILAVFFQGEFLARLDGPVPFLIVPNYLEASSPKDWMGVGHETGHHIYRQILGLREEIEVTVSKALQNSGFGIIQERLWFHYLEESFADLVGVLTLGAAFVYEQHVIIRKFVPDDELGGKGNRDLTHPFPLLRGQMGIYIYEKLLAGASADLTVLQQEWNEVAGNAQAGTLPDPHSQLPEFLTDNWNPTGSLDLVQTVNAMKLVVDTLLTAKLQSLNCHSIGELLKFPVEEGKRLADLQRLSSGQTLVWDKSSARIQAAASRLAFQQT